MTIDSLFIFLTFSVLLAPVVDSFTPNQPPPRPSSHRFAGGSDGSDSGALQISAFPRFQRLSGISNETTPSKLRGGDASDVVKGTKATLSSTSSYWNQAITGAATAVSKPFRAIKGKVQTFFKDEKQKREEELLAKLETMDVLNVSVEGETILPKEVVYLTAKRTGVLNRPLANSNIQKFAEQIKDWYDRNGYVLHRVTGATLDAETATALIQVQEPKTSDVPVDISFCKEMVVDQDTGNIMTFKQYKQRHQTRRTFGFDKLSRKDLNTTLVPTDGRTRPNCISRALNLKPNRDFQWDSSRWGSVTRSGVFKNVLRASPQALPDGTVQFNILATESPSRHLEYGVAKSLYTGSWEGEVEFEHINVLGGGEKLGLNVRRGAKDPEPSVSMSFSNDNFGLEGGYNVEVFKDYIGDQQNASIQDTPREYANDALLDRRGATIRIRNPIDTNQVKYSLASGSVERIASKSGLHESIGSTSLSVGPFNGELPTGARWNVDAKLTLGTRVEDRQAESEKQTFRPFGALAATTRQILPLLSGIGLSQRQVVLALEHSFTSSTSSLPRHEAKAQGVANKIRGLDPFGRAFTAFRGTTELRVPVDLRVVRDSDVVLFGDWAYVAPESKLSFKRQSCLGVGFRKSFQGIPLKFDLSYGSDGKVRNNVGLGQDFSV